MENNHLMIQITPYTTKYSLNVDTYKFNLDSLDSSRFGEQNFNSLK